jgi:hypothetical protein
MKNARYTSERISGDYKQIVEAVYIPAKQEVKLTRSIAGYTNSIKVVVFDMRVQNAHNELTRAISSSFTALESYLNSIKITTDDVDKIFEIRGFNKHEII